MTFFTCFILILSGTYTIDYLPPPEGIGSEILPLNARAFGMGGICAGVPDETGFSILNPAASAFAVDGGLYFSGRYSYGDLKAWDNRLGFPVVSALVPLPGGIVLSGSVNGRSRIESELESAAGAEHSGEFSWSGGLVETYAGVSLRICDWMAFSVGGRYSFGNILSDVTLISLDTIPPFPINSQYRDDARFRMASGGVFGLMVDTERFGLGFSISTDRMGDLEVNRDFLSTGETDSSSYRYSIPGEISFGISVRPIDRLLIGADIYKRKVMNILESRTDPGSIYSFGAELIAGGGISARSGFSYMDGLWRDGAKTFTAGAGYSFSEGRAGVDIAAGYQYWRDVQSRFQEETVLSFSVWITEKWLSE